MPLHTVAAVIPTKNAAAHIRGALDSLWFCEEVIVVDMHSTDETRAICESYPNVRFFERDGYIYHNFNFGMEQARSEWIIRLDSDERLSLELQREIIALLDGQPGPYVYEAPATTYVLGLAMPSLPMEGRTTLFRKGTLAYAGLSEHEDLTPSSHNVQARRLLNNPYLHFTMPTISRFLLKMDYYTDRDLERLRREDVKVTNPWRLLTRCMRLFIYLYWRRDMRRHGHHGFALTMLDVIYVAVTELKAWAFVEDLAGRQKAAQAACDRKLASHRDQALRVSQGAMPLPVEAGR